MKATLSTLRRLVPAIRGWPCCRCLLLWLGLASALSPAHSQTPPARIKPFIVASDTDGALNQYGKRAYIEAFRRLGIPLKWEIYPLARREALMAKGLIDAEAARVLAYADTHPELIRVEESLADVKFSLFAASPALHAKSLAELPATALVEYRRGILMCENTLKKAIPSEQLSDIITPEQGIKKLLAGRSDVYCDLDSYVVDVLHDKSLRGTRKVRKLFEIASLPIYPYLNRRHADLAPRLAATLKQMKTEGLLDRYGTEAGLTMTVRR